MASQARLHVEADGARYPAWLHTKRVRPVPCGKPHDMQKGSPGREKFPLRLSAYALKARGGQIIPRLACIDWLSEVRHEEHVKVCQMIGHIFRGKDDILQQCAVFRSGQALCLGERFRCGGRLRNGANSTNPGRINERVEWPPFPRGFARSRDKGVS